MKYVLICLLFKMLAAAPAGDNCGAIPMTKWAGAPSLREDPLPQPVKIAVIQHTVSSECNDDAECETILKGIRTYHMNNLKFTDIGQSFLIGGNGNVYEGAGWSLVGAHTLKYNARSISISFIGDFRKKLPSPQALKAAQDLIACGVANKHLAEDYHLVGHGQLSLTESPGKTLQQHIQTWPHWLDNAKEVLQ